MPNTILYVDDDKIARDGFATYFRRKQYDVHAFETAAEAEMALVTLKPQVIISDQKLGENSLGWEFLKRSIALSPDSVRFILSGYSDSQMILHSFRDGVIFDYIEKRASNEEIELKIKGACAFWHALNGKGMAVESREELLLQLIFTKKELNVMSEQLTMKDLEIAKLNHALKQYQQNK